MQTMIVQTFRMLDRSITRMGGRGGKEFKSMYLDSHSDLGLYIILSLHSDIKRILRNKQIQFRSIEGYMYRYL